MDAHKSLSLLVTLLSLLASGRAAAGGNIVLNGGFETGDFTDWTLSGNTTYTYVSDRTNGLYAPHGGSDYALLGATGSLGEMSQTVATTPGQPYTFSWWLASDGDYENQFSASWNGTVVFDQSDLPTQGYTQYDFTVTATSALTTITFSYQDDPGFLSLDDVSVTALSSQTNSDQPQTVPEPSSVLMSCMLVLTVAAAFGCHRRRAFSS